MVRCGPRCELVVAAGDVEVEKVMDAAGVTGTLWSWLNGDEERDMMRMMLLLRSAAWQRKEGMALSCV